MGDVFEIVFLSLRENECRQIQKPLVSGSTLCFDKSTFLSINVTDVSDRWKYSRTLWLLSFFYYFQYVDWKKLKLKKRHCNCEQSCRIKEQMSITDTFGLIYT